MNPQMLTALTMIMASQIGWAAPTCYDRALSNYGKLIEKTMEIVDSGSHRETVDSYAKTRNKPKEQVEAKTSATGLLKCPSGLSSANLIVKGDVILASGHPFIRNSTCVVRARAQDCTFQIQGQEPVKVAQQIASGSLCPQKTGVDADWTILKLEKPIQNVTPYKIKKPGAQGLEKQKVLEVSAGSVDFRRYDNKTKSWIEPKHLQDCAITRIFYIYDPNGLGTNCDQSHGSSGAAMLDPNQDEPTIIALVTGATMTEAEGDQEIRTGKPIRKKYDQDKWHGVGLAIDGRLYEALDQATR